MLKRVSIQNFKSLKDVTLDLQKVNLLIGPNNSGKTNFLKALEFFELSVLKSESAALYEAQFFRYKRSAQSLSINLTLSVDENDLDFLRSFDFSDPITIVSSQRTFLHGLEVAFSDSGYPNANDLQQLINNVKIYKPDPNKLTQPSLLGNGAGPEIVDADASNLIAFFDYIRDEHLEAFARIRNDLQKCVPEFTEINFQNVSSNNNLVNQFGPGTYKRLGLTDDKHGVKYWADELSEGTLYFLALLCIINQPNPPKLLLLEEPEKGIHPRRIREVMDFIFRLAEEKDIQIILTTHNEHVLDDFATRPESVFVFDKDEEGATYVRNLQTDIIEPTNKRNSEMGLDPIDLTTNLSENWLYGLLGGVPSIV